MVQLFDQAISAKFGVAERRMQQELAERGKSGEDRQALLDDLLLAGSLKVGHAIASLLVGKLSASGRQNALAAALKEYGALRRTIYAARYLSDPAYRRKIARQLNKG